MDSALRRFLFLAVVLVLLSGVVVLGTTVATMAQSDTFPSGHPIPDQGEGESVFTGATPELLAAGLLPAAPPQPGALALQRLTLAPGGTAITPAGDPRVVLLYVERGTLTVSNSVVASVTRGAALATPGAEVQEAIPAETAFTMRAGDAFLSPAGSGGELRNDGSEEVVILASIIVPLPAGTPVAGTPVP